jgi:hypothetical protein
VENYFNYLTDIEQHFCRRRGSGLQLSPLDWVLMETWKDAGIPLEAVLRGIDATFDHYDRRPAKAKIKKINGLAWCTQEILSAAAEMKEAATGSNRPPSKGVPGLGHKEIAAFLTQNAATLRELHHHAPSGPFRSALGECADSLLELAAVEEAKSPLPHSGSVSSQLDDLERNLTVLEEKLQAALMLTASEADLIQLRAEADREIAPYRTKMPGFQIEQLRKQFVHKQLFEKAKIPRLSLFYL